ncbi:MAG: hypothetical protein CUN57_02510, partial [Phototrophicales bacterium]
MSEYTYTSGPLTGTKVSKATFTIRDNDVYDLDPTPGVIADPFSMGTLTPQNNDNGVGDRARRVIARPLSPDELIIKGPDGDDDGVPDEEEDGAFNQGDGNDDGIPDSQQKNVASKKTPHGYMTVYIPELPNDPDF